MSVMVWFVFYRIRPLRKDVTAKCVSGKKLLYMLLSTLFSVGWSVVVSLFNFVY